jgi:hypothetical protein
VAVAADALLMVDLKHEELEGAEVLEDIELYLLKK